MELLFKHNNSTDFLKLRWWKKMTKYYKLFVYAQHPEPWVCWFYAFLFSHHLNFFNVVRETVDNCNHMNHSCALQNCIQGIIFYEVITTNAFLKCLKHWLNRMKCVVALVAAEHSCNEWPNAWTCVIVFVSRQWRTTYAKI